MDNKIEEKHSSWKWWVLITVIVGTFLGRLDQSIVNLALPTIIDDFQITVSAASWIATAYIIANAVFVPVWGKLGDTMGRKKIYIFGFVVFIIGSVLAGLSWNLSSMIIFRIIQAIAGSADYPTAMAILAITFRDGKQRAQALGIWSASFAAASVFGPLIGGPLIDSFGWRSVFLINIPVGILGLVMALFFIEESVSKERTVSFDVGGALTLGVFLSALVLVLDKGLDWGWTSSGSLIAYAVSIIFLIAFIYIEKNHKEPLVDFKFFRNSIFMSTLTNNFIVFMSMMGAIFLIPLFAQTFLGYTATQTGYLFIPMAFMIMIAAPIGGKFIGKIKANYIMAISTFIAGVGIFLFSVMMDPRSTALDIIIPLSIFSFGMGLGMSQRTNSIAAAVPTNEIGVASSVLALARNIAGAFGIAIFASILNNALKNNIINLSQNSVIHSTSPGVYAQVAGLITLKADILSYITVFRWASFIIMIGAVVSLLVKIKDKPNVHVHVE